MHTEISNDLALTVIGKRLCMVLGICLLALVAQANEPETPQAAPALPKLVDLGAKKCIPCKMMAPVLAELSKTYAGVFEVEFIDVWLPENKEKAQAYSIQLIPTQIFLAADGKELWRHEGFLSKEEILSKWQELGFTFKAATPVDEQAKQNE